MKSRVYVWGVMADMGTNFARYIPHYTQFVASKHYQIQRAVYVMLYRFLPATIPLLVGSSENLAQTHFRGIHGPAHLSRVRVYTG